MKRAFALIALLVASSFVGVQEVRANPELLIDDSIPCSTGSNMVCSRTTTEYCASWKLVEVKIGTTTEVRRECVRHVSTTTYKYVRPY